MESQVFLPIITALFPLPIVTFLKKFISALKRHGSLFSFPIPPSKSAATINAKFLDEAMIEFIRAVFSLANHFLGNSSNLSQFCYV